MWIYKAKFQSGSTQTDTLLIDAKCLDFDGKSFCSTFQNEYIFSGPSKSLTFEEGLVGNGEAGAGGENAEPKKVPDPCCPIVCERM